MMPDISARSMRKNNDYSNDLSSLIRTQEASSDREKELSLYRSGSAPPTVEGSLSSFGSLWEGSGPPGLEKFDNKRFVTEEELRADPAYFNYYYSNVNLNPRLPPPLISKEDWRFKQRFQESGLGGVGSRRYGSRENGDNETENWNLFPSKQGKRENEDSEAGLSRVASEWGGNGLTGLTGLNYGSSQKSFAEIIQNDSSDARTISRQPSRPASRNTFDINLEVNDEQSSYLHQDISIVTGTSALASHTYAAALGTSKSRSSTPDPRLVAIAPSPRITPVGAGRVNSVDKGGVYNVNSFHSVSPSLCESADLVGAFSGMNLSTNSVLEDRRQSRLEMKHDNSNHHNNLFNFTGDQNHVQTAYVNKGNFEKFPVSSAHQSAKGSCQSNTLLMSNEQVEFDKPAILSANSRINEFSTLVPNGRLSSISHHQNVDYVNSFDYGLSGYAFKTSSPSMVENGSFPALFENASTGSAMGVSGFNCRALGGLPGSHLLEATSELQNAGRFRGHNSPVAFQSPMMDPSYLQYLKINEYNAAQVAVLSDHTLDMDHIGNSHLDLNGIQKGYLETFAPQESQFSVPGYYGNPSYSPMSYPQRTFSSHLVPNSPVGLGRPIRYSEYGPHFSSGMRNLLGSIHAPWHLEAGGNLDGSFASSLLEEFKNNKTKCFELSEIAGHVVDFSADQYGSRFIQQKLETASMEEKTMVFHEILPQALSLMTDVFGNYVIQKFFEHGSASQIRELAEQLTGHVLALSLQMYGCRVIQKAIEVVDLDMQIKMVNELDGQIMCCVRDQNGNHVIQKCIECVPENKINFIVSTFYDQVVTLSTHPYGCRVIQRVLEHCHDAKTQHIMMDEILQSVCLLAQDQYGNYVVQHVLEHGEGQERSAIISKLMGQIVQMSQQKFASNVIEKCLTFGTSAERQILVNEMLGSTDENEPLQAMMKDQFGNYVVQKVLEACDDQQLELILNRIKVHLTALKKYTYGKHIVARVEKLVAAGERRISILTLQPAVMV